MLPSSVTPRPQLNIPRSLHYHKIVQNEIAVRTRDQLCCSAHTDPNQGYPEEWFPSVSATIGDRYPERSVFMLFIALTSGTLSDDTLSTQADQK